MFGNCDILLTPGEQGDSLLLLGHTDGATTTTGGLGVLTAHTQTPEVSESTVSPDLLQPLKIFSQLVVETVSKDLAVLAILNVLLSVEEPVRDFVLAGILHNGHHPLHLIVGQLSSSFVEVDIGLPQDDMGIASANTLNGSDGEGALPPSINIRVENTKDVLELLRDDQRHLGSGFRAKRKLRPSRDGLSTFDESSGRKSPC